MRLRWRRSLAAAYAISSLEYPRMSGPYFSGAIGAYLDERPISQLVMRCSCKAQPLANRLL